MNRNLEISMFLEYFSSEKFDFKLNMGYIILRNVFNIEIIKSVVNFSVVMFKNHRDSKW